LYFNYFTTVQKLRYFPGFYRTGLEVSLLKVRIAPLGDRDSMMWTTCPSTSYHHTATSLWKLVKEGVIIQCARRCIYDLHGSRPDRKL